MKIRQMKITMIEGKENEKLDSHRLATLCKFDWKCNEVNDINMM